MFDVLDDENKCFKPIISDTRLLFFVTPCRFWMASCGHASKSRSRVEKKLQ